MYLCVNNLMASSTDDRGLKHDRYMRFLASAAESEYLNTVDIHIATGGNAMVGYYPIRRASYLAQRLQEYPYDNLVPFGNSHDFWAFCVECISHALHLKDSDDSKQAYYYLCLAGTFNGLTSPISTMDDWKFHSLFFLKRLGHYSELLNYSF